MLLRPLVARLRGPYGNVMRQFAVERSRNPDLAAAFDRLVVGAKRAHVRRLLEAAVVRGDLPPDTDIELVAESGPAIVWHHALHGLPLTDDLPTRVLDVVLPSTRVGAVDQM